MARITFIDHDGVPTVVELPPGGSLMAGAVANNVPGIDADCGGACACGTCHVHVSEAWWDRLDEKTPAEVAMLDFAPGAGPGSRLSCQITVTVALDGLTVRIPASQR